MTPRTLKWLLVASLVVNLLFVGAFAGAWLRHGPPGGFGHGGRSFERFVEIMPEADRPAVRAILDRHADEVRSAREAVADARQAVEAALVADPFDRASADAAFGDLDAKTAAMIRIVQAVILDVAAMAPADVRARLLDRPMR